MRTSREPWIWPAVIATAFRITLFAVAAPHPERFMIDGDSREYFAIARNMVLGHGFTQAERPPYRPDVRRTPVYPSMLALVLVARSDSVRAAAIASLAASIVTAIAIVPLTARLFGAGAGATAGVLFSLDVTSAAYSIQLLTEPLFTLLICLAFLAATDLSVRERTLGITSGMLTGIAALCRPIGLFLAAALVPALMWRASRTPTRVRLVFVVALAASAVPIGLWTVRNRRVSGVTTFTSQVATNVYFHRAAHVAAELEHRPIDIVRDEWEREFNAASATWTQAERIAWMNEHGGSVVWAHPVTYAVVFLKGLVRMVRPDSDVLPPLLGVRRSGTAWRILLAVAWVQLIVVYALAAHGTLVVFRRSRAAALVPLALIAYFLLLAGPEMYPRFRVPIMPAVCMLAAAGVRSGAHARRVGSPQGTAGLE